MAPKRIGRAKSYRELTADEQEAYHIVKAQELRTKTNLRRIDQALRADASLVGGVIRHHLARR